MNRVQRVEVNLNLWKMVRSHQNEAEVNEKGNDDIRSEPQCTVRRSSRQREKSKRLIYPYLGNLLMTVVQFLFQSLSTAMTDSDRF